MDNTTIRDSTIHIHMDMDKEVMEKFLKELLLAEGKSDRQHKEKMKILEEIKDLLSNKNGKIY